MTDECHVIKEAYDFRVPPSAEKYPRVKKHMATDISQYRRIPFHEVDQCAESVVGISILRTVNELTCMMFSTYGNAMDGPQPMDSGWVIRSTRAR